MQDLPANVLRLIREDQGIGMAQLARKSGVQLPDLSKTESGNRPLSAEMALKTGRVLGVDPVILSIAHNAGAIKARIESGQDSPRRAAILATSLLRMLEAGELTGQQSRTARSVVVELVNLLEDRAKSAAGGTLEHEELMDSLDRDLMGRRKKKPRRGGDAVDPNLTGVLESGEYARKYSETTYEYLDRDNFGRKLPP